MIQNKNSTIINTTSIRDAVKKMDIEKLNTLIVFNKKKKVVGIFTMGDFRRVVFFGLDIEEKISSIINKNFIYLMGGFSKNQAKKLFTDNNLIMDIPVLNKNFELIKIISRKDFFYEIL